jgi:choline transport protein
LLLWHRLRGTIADTYSPENAEPGRIPLVWGPWRLRGIFGIANNVFTVAYLLVMFFFSFWPSTAEVTPATMNYTALLFGATMLFSVAYYMVFARHTYRGPVFEVDM